MAVYLITGGARSGKSTYAENLALRLCKDSSRRCYIATAEAFDDEMRSRIKAHQDRRAGQFFDPLWRFEQWVFLTRNTAVSAERRSDYSATENWKTEISARIVQPSFRRGFLTDAVLL